MKAHSVGIIIDGNRRWARERGLLPYEGHRDGVRKVREVIDWAKERGHISDIVFYTLSTENWKRTSAELEYLLLYIELFFRTHAEKLRDSGVRVRIVGERERFSYKLQEIFRDIEDMTAANTGLTVWFGLSYGGRAEILDAAFKLQNGKHLPTEEKFKSLMWTANLPDPDLILRTGGEWRLSNFLTWGSVYSELFFIDTYWPSFSKEEFFAILDEFEARERRLGA